MKQQESSDVQEQSSLDAFTDQCADLCERVLAGEITWDDAANVIFGPEPEITYTRWSAA